MIRLATSTDAAALLSIYTRAVEHISPAQYSADEKAAWLAGADTLAFWLTRISHTRPWLAEHDGEVAGFIEYLSTEAYIDCLYVHPAHQRAGVATALLQRVLQQARQCGHSLISADVSAAAIPFFQHHGFVCLHQNRIERQGVILRNQRMQRLIQPQTTTKPD